MLHRLIIVNLKFSDAQPYSKFRKNSKNKCNKIKNKNTHSYCASDVSRLLSYIQLGEEQKKGSDIPRDPTEEETHHKPKIVSLSLFLLHF